MTTASPYGRTTFHGKLLDNATISALQAAEEKLGYELTVVQGIGGAQASAGTHLEGRAVDLAPYDHDRKVKVLKQLGFACWYRPDVPGLWGAHIHAVLILNSVDNNHGIAASAFRQIGSFLRRCNGLANDAPDPDPWRADPQPVYLYPPKVKPVRPTRTKVSRARDRLAAAQAELLQCAALLDEADASRVRPKEFIDDVQRMARRVELILDQLPAR